MKSRITVSTAILSIIVLAGGLMAALVSLLLYSHNVRDTTLARSSMIEGIYLQLDATEIGLLMARRAEKDYLLRRDPKYLDRHAATMTEIHAAIAAVQSELPQVPELRETAASLPGLGAAIAAYETSFNELAEANILLGLDENSGLEGRLRTAVKDAESTLETLNQPEMQVKMLMMRRHEKDFIMRQDTKYLDRLNARVDEFRTFPADYYQNAAQQTEILGLMETYRQTFADYVAQSMKEKELRREVSAHFSDAEPLLDAAHRDVRALLDVVHSEGEAASTAAQTNALRAAIGGSVVFLLVALLLAQRIARPLKRIDGVLTKMMKGDFTPSAPKSAIREISAISQAIAGFRDAEAAKQELTAEIATVINACGEGDFSRRINTRGSAAADNSLSEGVNTIGEVAQKGLSDVLVVLNAVADGDLTQRMPDGQKGIFGEIAVAINNLTTSLETVVRKLAGSSEMLNNTSQEIASAVADASRRGEASAASLEETSAALQIVSDTVRGTADSAQNARQFVNDAQGRAETTREVGEQTVAAMQRIKDSSDAISKITGLIDDVAFQTNLLALNAGVEAARAGEAGRGFAVVASEVRALAQRSSDAAKEISTLIRSSQEEVTSGVSLADETGASLSAIFETIAQAANQVNEIAENTTEQANGISEVNVTLESLDRDSQQSAAMLEQTAASGQMLREEAASLAQAISGFRLAEDVGAIQLQAPPTGDTYRAA